MIVNCNWFYPYKFVRTRSIGAINVVITNLPRSIRFKIENVILIGIIPDLEHEQSTTIVDEVLEVWN